MKVTPIFHLIFRLFIFVFVVSCLALPQQLAHAEGGGYQEESDNYSQEELAQMLAPIALYPDTVLSQILMASTTPREIVEADRWLNRNQGLVGDALDAQLLDKNWPPSVKSMCHFPSILSLMSRRIAQTTNLGNAFFAQEAEVMDMVQELRASAYAQGNLTTTSQQKVIAEREMIIIQPVEPNVIYLPYYDPFYIYGPWWYPAYPPYYWGPSGVYLRDGISYWPRFYVSFDFGIWSYFDWHRHYIYIDTHKRPRFVRQERWTAQSGRWQQAPRGLSEHQGLQRDPRGGERSYIDQGKREDSKTRINRDRQDRERVEQERRRIEQELKERAKKDGDRQERERLDQEHGRVKQDLKEREKSDRDRQGRERLDQERGRIEQDVKERGKNERDRQERERLELKKKEREQAEYDRQERERLERSKAVPRERAPDQRPDNNINRGDRVRTEHEANEPGRPNRQRRDGDTRDGNHSDNDGRNDRDDNGERYRR